MAMKRSPTVIAAGVSWKDDARPQNGKFAIIGTRIAAIALRTERGG